MIKSKTKIGKQLVKKGSQRLVETILAAKKNDKWIEVAGLLSGPRMNFSELNLKNLEDKSKQNEIILVPGKVLSDGEINKKIKVVALGFSAKAEEKLKKAGCETSTILEEIKKNPSAQGLRILK